MKIFLILVVFPLQLIAQDITGVWSGSLEAGETVMPYEIVITGSGEKLSGYSLIVFTFNGIENVGVKSIKLKRKQGAILIEDFDLVYDNYTTDGKRIKLFCSLVLRQGDTSMILTGNFRTRTMDFRAPANTYSGTVKLEKQNSYARTKLINTLEEMNLLSSLSFLQPNSPVPQQSETVAATTVKEPAPQTKRNKKDVAKKDVAKAEKPALNETETKKVVAAADKNLKKDTSQTKARPPVAADSAAADLAKRKTEIIQSVFFKADSLVLSLYDHGVVDGDTVSVVLNGKVIIAKQRLNSKAMRSVLHVTPDLGDSLQLVMYAENLGTIPPNTGVLIIQDGAARHEIRFVGNKQMSSGIILRRKK